MNARKMTLSAMLAASFAALLIAGLPPATAAPGDGKLAAGEKRERPGAANGGTTNGGTPERRPGTVVDDSVITARVKTALIGDDDVKALDINVTTRKGEVVLSGDVESQNQANRAIQLASNVEGVKSVSSKLKVKNNNKY
jgi:hypothetical protein